MRRSNRRTAGSRHRGKRQRRPPASASPSCHVPPLKGWWHSWHSATALCHRHSQWHCDGTGTLLSVGRLGSPANTSRTQALYVRAERAQRARHARGAEARVRQSRRKAIRKFVTSARYARLRSQPASRAPRRSPATSLVRVEPLRLVQSPSLKSPSAANSAEEQSGQKQRHAEHRAGECPALSGSPNRIEGKRSSASQTCVNTMVMRQPEPASCRTAGRLRRSANTAPEYMHNNAIGTSAIRVFSSTIVAPTNRENS